MNNKNVDLLILETQKHLKCCNLKQTPKLMNNLILLKETKLKNSIIERDNQSRANHFEEKE